MKTLKYLALGFLAIAGLTLQSCNHDDSYDVRGERGTFVYIDNAVSHVKEVSLYHSPVGEFGQLSASFPVKVQYAVNADLTVTPKVDNNLVAKYNEEHETEFAAFPAEAISALDLVGTVIKKGNYTAESEVEVSLSEEFFPLLPEPEYLLPVRMTVFSPVDVRGSEDYGVYYIIVHTSSKMVAFTGNLVSKHTIVDTPVGRSGGNVTGSFRAMIREIVESDVEVTLVPNNELVNEYNVEYSAGASALPAAALNALEITGATISAGASQSGQMTAALPDDVALALPVGEYVVPMNLKYTYATGDVVVDEEQVVYLYINVFADTRLVRANGTASDMLGSRITSYSGWTSNPSGLIKSNGSINTNWSMGSEVPATFIVDMQQERTFTGFTFNPMYASWYGHGLAALEVSTDGNNWTECGKLAEDEIYQSGSTCYYTLYGPVVARYLKVTVEVPIAAQYGTYYNRLQGFAVYVDER